MLEKVLIPLDASSLAERVLPFVTNLASAMKQPATIVTVLQDLADREDLNPIGSNADALLAELNGGRRTQAEHYLEGIVEQLRRNDVRASAIVRSGKPADEIVATAAAEHCDLIVMATHGRIGPERWFLGSVADQVVRISDVPVLLLRPSAGVETAWNIRSVVVPLDGSPEAEQAIPYASSLASSFNVPVTLVRCQPMTWVMSAASADPSGVVTIPAELMEEIERAAVDYLDNAVQLLRSHGIDAKAHFGGLTAAASEIVRVAESAPGALVVMTTHGRSGIGRTLLGSVADKVIRSCSAPVLMVRPQA